MALVYRIQPQGADLHGVQTEASDGTIQDGIHVFESLPEVYACGEWLTLRDVELAEVECAEADLRPNGDYEGVLLLRGRGRIVRRSPFRDTRRLARWVDLTQHRR